MKLKSWAAVLFAACLAWTAEARLELGSPFVDGAVLQREKPVNVWGWADPSAQVTVTFAGQAKSAVAEADGRWLVTLAPMVASKESRRLTVATSTASLVLEDVLVGEVWLCSGQSNMEFSLCGPGVRSRERDGYLTAQMTHRPDVRYLGASLHKTSFCPEAKTASPLAWQKFEPAFLTKPGASAIAVYYALELRAALDVPIGVIVAAWGGTDIAPWIPREGLEATKGLEDLAAYEPRRGDAFKKLDSMPNMTNSSRQPTIMYNALVAPLAPYSVRGILWYQGESDRGETGRYALKMHAYFDGMKAVFRDPSLKYYFVQIANWKHGQHTWHEIRLQQAKFAAEEPNAEMVVTADVGNPDEIHPYDKKPVAKRLAAFALRNDYGFADIQCDFPAFARATSVTGGVVRLAFDHAKELAVYNLTGKPEVDLDVAGPDGVFHQAEIVSQPQKKRPNQFAGGEILVFSEKVAEPKKVRYLYKPFAHGAIVNETGLPAGPFEGVVGPSSGHGGQSDDVVAAVSAATAATPAMERLPPGSTRPQGWLLKQMELQRSGLTGHAEDLYEDIGKSDWLTGGKLGGQFAWERGPYYAKGLTALAFALDDEALKARAKRWIDAYLASQRANGDFGPRERNWWANMIVLWTLRDWCEATGDVRVVPFLERYFAFQRSAFECGDSFEKDSFWAVARAGDELDVVIWLWRKTGKGEWLDYARTVAAMSADWTDYYHNCGKGGWGREGYRDHIVNFMQGLKTPPLKWLLGAGEADRAAFRSALAPDGWAMRKYGRPDRAVNGTEPLSSRSSTQGTELCATVEHILSAQVALETLGDADIADDMEVVAYNTLPATLAPDGKGMRYYCLLNQPCCIDGIMLYNNGQGFVPNMPGPYSGFGCCRSNFHFAWPKFTESMWMRREGGLAATAYGDCTVKTPVATIAETGGYPFSDCVRLEIVESAGGVWPLFVRIPGWCKEAKVKVNGEDAQKHFPRSASFLRLARNWRKGDVVELSLPSKPVVTHWKDDSIAVMRGPLLYALKIDAGETARNAADWPALKKDANGVLRDGELGFPMKELRPMSPWNYALVADGANGEPRFHVKGAGLGLRLAVKAVRTDYAGWGTMRADATARVKDPPPSPVPSAAAQGKVETLELAPIALTQLRITLFPWMKGGEIVAR